MKWKPLNRIFFRNRQFHAISVFLVGMAVMTVISRAADSFMIPQVQITSPETMKLQYPLEIQGRVVPENQYAVYCPENLRIGQVQVQKNDIVAKGDLLFSADPKDLQDNIRKTEQEMEKLKLQIADLKSSQNSQTRQHELDLNRAQEDYDDTAAESEAAVTAAYLELEQAQNELALHESQKPEETLNSQKSAPKADTLNSQEDSSDSQENSPAESNPDSQENSPAEGSSDSQENNPTETESPLEAWNRKREELEEICRENQKRCEETVAARNKSLKAAARQIEDASLPLTEDHTADLLQADLENQNRTLQELKELSQSEGSVYAEYDGQILECSISTGSITSPEPAIILGDFSQSFRFEGILNEAVSEEDMSYQNNSSEITLNDTGKPLLVENMEGILRMQDGSIPEKSVKITGVSQEEGGACRITADLDGQEISRSGEAVLDLTGESRIWPCCVPLSSLHSRESGDFVIKITESPTILGLCSTAEYVPVTVLEKNSEYAAVEGLSPTDQIIATASKNVKEGDRIRIIED